jgi:hypothetical protein
LIYTRIRYLLARTHHDSQVGYNNRSASGLDARVSKDGGLGAVGLQGQWRASVLFMDASMVVGLGGKHGGRAQRWAWWPASVAGSPDDGANGGCYFCASNPLLEAGIVMPRLWSCNF